MSEVSQDAMETAWEIMRRSHYSTWPSDAQILIARALADQARKTRAQVVAECVAVAEGYHAKWGNANGFDGHTAAARVIAQVLAKLENPDADI